MQGSSGDAGVENGLVDTVQGGEGGMSREWHSYMYTLPGVTWIASGNLQFCRASSARCCADLDWWDWVVVEGRLEGKEKNSVPVSPEDVCTSYQSC